MTAWHNIATQAKDKKFRNECAIGGCNYMVPSIFHIFFHAHGYPGPPLQCWHHVSLRTGTILLRANDAHAAAAAANLGMGVRGSRDEKRNHIIATPDRRKVGQGAGFFFVLRAEVDQRRCSSAAEATLPLLLLILLVLRKPAPAGFCVPPEIRKLHVSV